MFERVIAFLFPLLAVGLSAFLLIRLKVGKNKEAGGAGLIISGLILIFLAALVNFLQHLPGYNNWFLSNIYTAVNVIEFLLLLFGFLLTASGLILHFSFWGDRDLEISNHLAKLRTLESLQEESHQPMPMNELLDRMLRGILTGLEEEAGAIFLLNQSQRQFILSSAAGLTKDEISLLEYYPFGRNLISQAVEDETPLLSHDFRSLGGKAQLAASRFRSIMVLPLATGRSRLGAILFFSGEEKRYGREFINLVQPISSWLGEKIEITRLGREVGKNNRELEMSRRRFDELFRRLEKIFKPGEDLLTPARFTERCLGLSEFGEIWLLGLSEGKLQLHGGTRETPDFTENFRAALINALSRKKAVILNQEAIDDGGQTFISRSSLLLPADSRGNALLLRNENGPTELSENDLKFLEAVASLAGLTIAHETARRASAAKSRDMDAIAGLLRKKISPQELPKDLKNIAEYISDAMGDDILFLLFAVGEGRLKAIYAGRDEETSEELSFEIGEGSTGRVAVTGSPEFFTEPSSVADNLATYVEENRLILNRLFRENAHPSFQADYPIFSRGRAGYILTVYAFCGSQSEHLERHRLLSVLVGLLNLKIEIVAASMVQGQVPSELASISIAPLAANELNNDLAAISGYCQIIRRDPNLSGDIQSALDSMVSLSESMADRINTLASGTENLATASTDLNSLIRKSITNKSISGDLYMVAGRPTEVALNLKDVPALGIGGKDFKAFLDSVYSSFTENVTEDEIVTINTYSKDNNIYFDISRHRKNFPPVEPVANFGRYLKPAGVEGDLKSREFMRRLSEISGEFAYDRFSRYPSYYSFRFFPPSRSETAVAAKPFGEITVLAIDDQVVILELLAAMCQSMGYSILTAKNAEEGLRLFDERRPDVVIADLVMPGLSGLELTSRLKQIAPDLPVILITGWGMAIDDVRMKEAGVDYILHKPFRLEQLSELISKITADFRR